MRSTTENQAEALGFGRQGDTGLGKGSCGEVHGVETQTTGVREDLKESHNGKQKPGNER